MPYPLGAIAVSAGATYTIPVGSAGTVGAVVIANESPFSVQASAGAGGQWIVAQTTDLVACNVSGFNGNLTLSTDSYLSNSSEAPSFLLYLTVYAPGETIRGTYPAPLMRLASGNLSVGTNAGVTLEQDLFTPFILTGIVPSGVGTNQYSTTGGIGFTRQSDSSLLRTAVGATSQGPLAVSTTYFHDLNPDGTFHFSTSHSSQPNYLTIATVVTDVTGIISSITDTRVMSTLLWNSMSNTVAAPGVQLYNLHVNKVIQCDNQVSVQGNLRTTSGVGGTTGWHIGAGADSELNFVSEAATHAAQAIIFSSIPGQQPPFAIGSNSVSIALPLAWIDDNGVLHATAPVTLAAGNQETGACGANGWASALGNLAGSLVNFKTTLTNVPTSITLTVSASSNIEAGFPTTDTLTIYGFNFNIKSAAVGNFFWHGLYATVGNCLLAVDAVTRTLDHHCSACGYVSTSVPFAACQRVNDGELQSLAYACPACRATEHFNLMLTVADEADRTPQGSGEFATTRGAQATLIRKLMTALGLEVAA